MNKNLKARITKSREELWAEDTNLSKVFHGLEREEYGLWRRLSIITKEQAETASRGVLKFIRPYYDKTYYQTHQKQWCVYINQRIHDQKKRERINQTYFNGEMGSGRYDMMKYHPAEKEYLVFPQTISAEMNAVPLGFIRTDAVTGTGLYVLADPTPWQIVILSSALYTEWAKTVGSLGFYNGAELFPFPPKQEGDTETIESYAASLREIWESGQTDKLPNVLNLLNDYVDSLYRERCSMELETEIDPTDRLRYLFALCDKRGAVAKAAKELAEYNRRNILVHPDVPPFALPTMIAILHSKEPVHPTGLKEYKVSRTLEPYGIFSALTEKGLLRRIDTPQTVIDKNGRKLNTLYAAVPDFTDFFVEWIHFYLPEDGAKRREAWRLARLPRTEERNPLFPALNEYKTLKILWGADMPLSRKEIKEQGCAPGTVDKLLEKNLVEIVGANPARYRSAVPELEFAVIAVREILSKMESAKRDKVISKMNELLEKV